MATRKQIRTSFYAELEAVTSAYLDPTDITTEYPNKTEQLPCIVHNDSYRTVPINTGTAPVGKAAQNGGVQYIYVDIEEAVFSVTICAESEATKEDIYNTVKEYFGSFKYPYQNESDIQADIYRVTVGDTNSADSEQRELTMRGDSLDISLFYKKFYTRDETPIAEIEQNFDVDDDGVVDINRTVT
jgi:hypothetical protein